MVPVLGGIGFFGVLALVLWGIASLVSQNGSGATANLASTVFRPGSVVRYAAIIEEDGPVLFPDLLGTDGDKIDRARSRQRQPDGRLEHLPRPSSRSADHLQGHPGPAHRSVHRL